MKTPFARKFATTPETNIAGEFGGKEEMNSTKENTGARKDAGKNTTEPNNTSRERVNEFESHEESRKRLSEAFPKVDLSKYTVEVYERLGAKATEEKKSGTTAKKAKYWNARELGEFIADSWSDAPPMDEGVKQATEAYVKLTKPWEKSESRTGEEWGKVFYEKICDAWSKVVEKIKNSLASTKQELEELYAEIEAGAFPQSARKEAFYGIAGEVTEIICRNSELRPEAVLAQFLCIFGNMLGGGLYKTQEDDHGTVINVAIVGRTGDGAKGGSLKAVKRLVSAIDQKFFSDNLSGGHNSAEAILGEICDEDTAFDKNGEIVTLEEDVPDKRMVIVEEELSRIFQMGKRDGNTMSEILRQFYDKPKVVKALSRKSRLKATDPHVSILGHITPEGLKSSMPNVEVFNGFANRFTFIASQRTCSNPEPEVLDWRSGELLKKVTYLTELVGKVRPHDECKNNPRHELGFSPDGREKWRQIYHKLSRESSGKSQLQGALLARAKPTMLRLSMIYAVLDCSFVIQPEHLDAACALWDYSVASANWAFGQNSGNPDADKIHTALRRAGKKGLTLTQISVDVFSRHKPASDIREALSYLKVSDLARVDVKKRETWYVK
jgi:Protein of unknown function (DUF3987)